MIKREVTYKDFDDKEVTDELYFNIGIGEIIELEEELLPEGGLVGRLESVRKMTRGTQVFGVFRWLLEKAYGERKDGRFLKSQERSEEFVHSLAFDKLILELLGDPEGAAAFVNGIFPAEFQTDPRFVAARAEMEAGRTVENAEIKEVVLAPFTDTQSGLEKPRYDNGEFLPWAFRHPTTKEQQAMDRDQLIDVMKRQAKGWSPPEEAKPV